MAEDHIAYEGRVQSGPVRPAGSPLMKRRIRAFDFRPVGESGWKRGTGYYAEYDQRYTQGYKLSVYRMKTAISIEESLLLEADRLAGQMGLSRSRLFSLALRQYLRDRRVEELTDQLNQVYTKEQDSPERRVAKKMKAKFRATIKESW